VKAGYLACGGWIASAVGAAAALGLADLIGTGERSVAELAEATGTKEAALAPVLRLLASVGLFAEARDGRYRNTPDSEPLGGHHPQSVRSFCMLAAGDYQRAFHELMHTLRTGEGASTRAFGEPLVPYLEHHPDAGEVYDRAMEDLSRPMGPMFAAAVDLDGVSKVADLGGGRGGFVKGLLRVRPSLDGVVVDRAGVCARARAALPATDPDLVGRLEYVGADLFALPPVGADLYVIKNVLRNWGDEACVQVLGSIARAMAADKTTRLLILDTRPDADLPAVHRALDDLVPLVVSEPHARLRDAGSLGALLEAAGFAVASSRRVGVQHVLVEGRPGRA